MAIDSRIRVLSEEKIDRVHAATLKVLGEIGVQFKDNQARQIMTAAGAMIAAAGAFHHLKQRESHPLSRVPCTVSIKLV